VGYLEKAPPGRDRPQRGPEEARAEKEASKPRRAPSRKKEKPPVGGFCPFSGLLLPLLGASFTPTLGAVEGGAGRRHYELARASLRIW
jgi:hypothetical protein